MTSLGKFFLFFSSWFPAYAMVGLIAWQHHPRMAIACFVVTGVSIAVYFFMEKMIFGGAPKSLKIKELSRRDENVFMYVIAYLPPFFAVDPANKGQLAALGLFYVIFSITYLKLDLYYLNPVFIFRSYRTYTLVSDGGEEYVALIKRSFKPVVGDTVQYRGRDHILLLTGE